MPVSIITDKEEFAGLRQRWDRFVESRMAGNPFCRHFWFENYRQAFFAYAALYTIVVEEQGEIEAIFPAVATRRRLGGIPLKELRLIAGDHSHVNRLLVSDSGHEQTARLLERAQRDGFDLIYLEDLPDYAPENEWIEAYCRDRRLTLVRRVIRESPYIPTTGTFDDYRKTRSKKFRELLNNRVNRMNRVGGYEIREFTRVEDLPFLIEDLKTISLESWQHKSGSGLFSRPETAHFYERLLKDSLASGYGKVTVLYFENKPAASEIHLLHGKTEYCLKAEFAEREDNLSPGGVLDLELVKRAFSSDIERYDLLGYPDRYKMRWTDKTTICYRYFLFGRSAAARLGHLVYFTIGDSLRQSGIVKRIRRKAR
jgi:CelD/BcsL family acetyltransferase involved in cellulose biosynthesis